jgi:PBP1b-binding outer membrane lipoprotein LpoB
MTTTLRYSIALLSLLAIVGGCTTYESRTGDREGRPSQYVDPNEASRIQGLGIASNDIASVCDEMVGDILANPYVAGRPTAPRIILDAAYFENASATRIDKNMITDRLRTELNRAAMAEGPRRLIFISRQDVDMVAKEREMKRQGLVDAGTTGTTRAMAGGDFRLRGSIRSLDEVGTQSGQHSRYHQINFELIDLETGEIIWSNMYDFKKLGSSDVVYR